MNKYVLIVAVVLLTIFFAASVLNAAGADSNPVSQIHPASLTATPIPVSSDDMFPTWMTPPPPSNTQTGNGAVIYYYYCMVCHGDKGQGLTLDWRAQWPVGHQDCAVPMCHGKRHPPESFELPHDFAPAIIGEGTLANYQTAQDLYNFISTKMPYQAPKSLTSDDYWSLVAYLLSRHGVLHEGVHLDASTASQVPIHPTAPDFTPVLAVGGVTLGALLIGSVSFLVIKSRRTAK
ncbi:MAG TPA: c-type cytochrome [Anaerolineae bacterium]|nr:c-type cytochrome [Anaerolineae bacterium]